MGWFEIYGSIHLAVPVPVLMPSCEFCEQTARLLEMVGGIRNGFCVQRLPYHAEADCTSQPDVRSLKPGRSS